MQISHDIFDPCAHARGFRPAEKCCLVEFATDSPLEQMGFKLSVPLARIRLIFAEEKGLQIDQSGQNRPSVFTGDQRFESHLLQQRVSRTPRHPIGPGETSKASRVAILPRQAGLRYVVEVKARANLPACRADPDRSVPADDRSADDGLGQAPRERPTLCSGHDQHDPSRLDEHRRTPRSSAFVPARSSSPAICRPMISEWYSNGVSLNSPAIVEY